jgi:hypothetical protein
LNELEAGTAARAAFASRPSPEFDSDRWWTTRRGVQSVYRGYVQWASAAWGGDSAVEVPATDWAAFEAAVARGEKP